MQMRTTEGFVPQGEKLESFNKSDLLNQFLKHHWIFTEREMGVYLKFIGGVTERHESHYPDKNPNRTELNSPPKRSDIYSLGIIAPAQVSGHIRYRQKKRGGTANSRNTRV